MSHFYFHFSLGILNFSFDFLQPVERYKIKNHCVTSSLLILIPLQCAKLYTEVGTWVKVKEIQEVKEV